MKTAEVTIEYSILEVTEVYPHKFTCETCRSVYVAHNRWDENNHECNQCYLNRYSDHE